MLFLCFGCLRCQFLHAIDCVVFSYGGNLEAAMVTRLDYHVLAVAGLIEITTLIGTKIAGAYYNHNLKI